MRRPPKVKGSWGDRAESLRQKDRAPEGVLESPARAGADGVTLSGLGQDVNPYSTSTREQGV